MDTLDTYIPDFTHYLLGNYKLDSKTYTLSIIEEDVKINANPVICNFIAYFLKNNMNVILLANQESLNHYYNILRKFSINLLKNDNFCCIDLFTEPNKGLNKYELPLCENFPYTFNSNRSKNFFTNVQLDDGELNLDRNIVLENIIQQIKSFKITANTFVIVDNLSMMPILDENMQDWINMLNKASYDLVNKNLIVGI